MTFPFVFVTSELCSCPVWTVATDCVCLNSSLTVTHTQKRRDKHNEGNKERLVKKSLWWKQNVRTLLLLVLIIWWFFSDRAVLE